MLVKDEHLATTEIEIARKNIYIQEQRNETEAKDCVIQQQYNTIQTLETQIEVRKHDGSQGYPWYSSFQVKDRYNHELEGEIKRKDKDILAKCSHIEQYFGEIEEKNDVIQQLHCTIHKLEVQLEVKDFIC